MNKSQTQHYFTANGALSSSSGSTLLGPTWSTSVSGLPPTWNAKSVKYILTQNPLLAHSPTLMPTSQTHTSILLGLYQCVRVSSTCWPSSIYFPSGWPLYQSKTLTGNSLQSNSKNWFETFGKPQVIMTDHGTQFQSSLFREFNNLLNSNTGLLPLCRRLDRKISQILKNPLATRPDTTNWIEDLLIILYSIS